MLADGFILTLWRNDNQTMGDNTEEMLTQTLCLGAT